MAPARASVSNLSSRGPLVGVPTDHPARPDRPQGHAPGRRWNSCPYSIVHTPEPRP
jgi:hypothetical protein